MSMQQLIEEHEAVDFAMSRVVMLASRRRGEAVCAVLALADLTDKLNAYFTRQCRILADRLPLVDNGLLAAALIDVIETMEELYGDWQDYLERWTLHEIAEDCDHFALATLKMVARHHHTTESCNERLCRTALRHGLIPLRKPPELSAAA